jgi:hypothetical protein
MSEVEAPEEVSGGERAPRWLLRLVCEVEPERVERVRALAREAWPKAQARWSSFLLLREPKVVLGLPSVAQIHLGERQISLDGGQIARLGLEGSIEAILAHEVGHHVRYPASLTTHARMRLLEKSLVPLDHYSMLNLFTDLLINESLGRELAPELSAVYRAFHGEIRGKRDPVFLFVMAVYEELWGQPVGSLMGPGWEDFARRYPMHRVDARLVAQKLFPMASNIYLQLLYFLSLASRYLAPLEGDKPESYDPYDCIGDEPSPEDWADALIPSAREREALARALKEGWLRQEDHDRVQGQSALERRVALLPGQGTGDASMVPEIMAAYYRQQAERLLIKPPPAPVMGEAVVPTSLDEWEPGDAVRDIDWLQTLSQRGPVLGAAAPLKRTLIAEVEGFETPYWSPRVEIYLDVSGSMPDPRRTRNAMTLAAQIMTLGATRAGGAARALLYSSEYVRYWSWCRSETEISKFLMHYVGGGTRFPFEVLADSVQEQRGQAPTRVVISDGDFVSNCAGQPQGCYDAAWVGRVPGLLREASAASAPLVLLLHAVAEQDAKPLRALGAQVVLVEDMEDFPKMAVKLSRALFQERKHGRVF